MSPPLSNKIRLKKSTLSQRIIQDYLNPTTDKIMYNKLFCIVTTLALMTGCTTDELADMNEQSGGPGINFGVTATSTDRLSRGGLTSTYQSLTLKSAETADTLAVTVETADYFIEEKQISRGTPIDGAENLDNFQVYAYYYASESTTTPSLFFEENVSKRDADTWATGTTYYWPTSGELAFFGMSPAVNNDFLWFDRYQAPAGENDAVISYIAPTEPEQQPDIVVASTGRMNNSESGEKVPMAFKHILSQVKFRVGAEMQAGTINSITLTNVVKHGYYHHAANGGAWSLDEAGEDQTCNYTVDLDEAVTEGSTGTDLGVTEQTLMMLPQTLGANCELVVEFTPAGSNETRTLRASLAGGEWTMGGTTVYNINIEPEYKVNFVEESLPTDALDCHFVRHTINVNAEELKGKNWTISSNQSWCKFRDQLHGPENQGFWIKSPTGYPTEVGNDATWKAEYDKYKTSGSMTMSAIGENIPVYVFLEENIREEERNAILTLSVDGKEVASTTISQSAPTVSGDYLMENIEEEKDLPWGFNWDRKVVYKTKQVWGTHVIPKLFLILISNSYSGVTGITVDIPLFGAATVTVDYSVMKPDESIGSLDGRSNTYSLFKNAGGNIVGFESQLDGYTSFFEKTSEGTLVDNGNYAALSCIKKNSFDIKVSRSEEKNSQTGEYEYQSVVNVSLDDVKWYLPASGQSGAFPTGGNYWSSTPAVDHSTAYMMVGGSSAKSTTRSTPGNVRAVRNRNN